MSSLADKATLGYDANFHQLVAGNSYLNRIFFNERVYTSDLDIDKIDYVGGYMLRMQVESPGLGTQPTSVIAGNSYILIGFSSYNSTTGGLTYGIQIAFGFGSNKIAIRNCAYNSSSQGSWSAWTAV